MTIAIIPCGKAKRDYPCLAREMYTGTYHKLCQGLALTLVPEDKIFILSALYGIVGLDFKINPYDMTFDMEGCIDVSTIEIQSKFLKIEQEPVIMIGGKKYASLVCKVWSNVVEPLRGKGGMGYQMQWMKQQIERKKENEKA